MWSLTPRSRALRSGVGCVSMTGWMCAAMWRVTARHQPSCSRQPSRAPVALAPGANPIVRYGPDRARSGRPLCRPCTRPGRSAPGDCVRRQSARPVAALAKFLLGDRRSGDRAPPHGRRRGAGGCQSRSADRESGRPHTRGGTRFSPKAGPRGWALRSSSCLGNLGVLSCGIGESGARLDSRAETCLCARAVLTRRPPLGDPFRFRQSRDSIGSRPGSNCSRGS
jgi:hypothetical protein